MINITPSYKTYATPKHVEPRPDARHPFERRGFGPGPYTFLGQEEAKYQACHGAPVQPGTSCDHCGTGIMDVYWFKSAAGSVFKVGCDCLRKAAKDGDDYPLQTEAARLKRAHDRKVRHSRESEKVEELQTMLADPKVRETLSAKPHPQAWRAARGETILDSMEWMAKNAGAAGKIATLKAIKAALVPQEFAPW